MFLFASKIASVLDQLMTPAPIIARVCASFDARYFVATAGTAPVRVALIKFALIYANGAPVSASFNVIIKTERGNPFSLLATFDPYHFCPVILYLPPKYAFIDIKRRSGPAVGIFSVRFSFGNHN